MKQELGEKFRTSLVVSSFFTLTLFFFGPTHLYFTNKTAISSSFSDIYIYFVVISLICFLVLATFLVILRSAFHEKIVSLFFVISFLLWFQGNVLVANYGPLDGTEIDWSNYRVYGLLGLAVWISFTVAGLVWSRHVKKIALKGSLTFIIVQALTVILAAIQAPDTEHFKGRLLESDKSIYEFSSERNVVMLILDAFQSDMFQEIVNQSPEYAEFFDGFIYYRNTVGGHQRTKPSVPLILTGQYYKNTVPILEFSEDVFSAGSVPMILKNNGYQVDLIGGMSHLFPDKIASNRAGLDQLIEQNTELKDAALLFDITLFKDLPQHLKKFVYNNQAWMLTTAVLTKGFGGFPEGFHRESIEFARKMSHSATAGNENYTFKYIHLYVSHWPVRVNEKLEYEEMEFTRENHIKQLKATLKLAKMILDRLKEIGVYDSSLIFVMADHGAGVWVNVEASGYPPENDSDQTTRISEIKGYALPLLLVKQFGSKGKLEINDAPISHADVAKTIVSELGLSTDIPGTSVFEIKESDIRHRRYLHDTKKGAEGARGQYKMYLRPKEEYIITGFGWLNESWHPTHRLYPPKEVK